MLSYSLSRLPSTRLYRDQHAPCASNAWIPLFDIPARKNVCDLLHRCLQHTSTHRSCSPYFFRSRQRAKMTCASALLALQAGCTLSPPSASCNHCTHMRACVNFISDCALDFFYCAPLIVAVVCVCICVCMCVCVCVCVCV